MCEIKSGNHCPRAAGYWGGAGGVINVLLTGQCKEWLTVVGSARKAGAGLASYPLVS